MKLIEKFTIKIIILIFLSSYSYSIELTKEEKDYIKNKKTILVSNEFDYEPYDFNKNGKALGYSIDLLELLLEDVDLEIKYVTKPWNNLLDDLNNNKIDLMHSIYKTDEREKIYNYSIGYSKVIQTYVIRDDEKDIKDSKELFGKKVGVTKGWTEDTFFDQYPQIQKVYYKNLDDKLKAISTGEIDAIMIGVDVSRYMINKYGYNNLKVSKYVIENFGTKINDHHFVTLKSDNHLISILDKAYADVSIDTINVLKKRWFGNSSYIPTNSSLDLSEKEKAYLDKKDSITMCIDPNWMPFEKFDKNGNYVGMSADYFKIFSQILNKEFSIIKTKKWSESIEFAKSRKCDILSLVMDTPQRAKYLNFTTPYLNTPLVIATKLDIQFINDIKDLVGKKVGIPKGYAFNEILRARYPSLEIVDVDNIDDGLNRVNEGKLYAYVGTLASVGYKFQTKYSGELKIAGKVDEQLSLGIGVRDDDAILFSILQKAVDEITFEQEREILNRWVSISYEKGIDYSLIIRVVIVASIILALVLYFLSKQVLLKKELAEQKEEFESIFRNAKDGIAILDLESNYLDFNDAYLEITGYSRAELLTKSCIGLTVPEDLEKAEKAFEEILTKGIIKDFEKSCEVKDGRRISVSMSGTLVSKKQKILLTVKDMTSIKLIEEQSRLVSMGEMIGNIAHQWRQPLSIISTSASGVKFKLEFDEKPDREYLFYSLDKIVEQTKYLSQTIDDFKNFIKGDKTFNEISLNDTIFTTLNLVESTFKNNYITPIIDCNHEIFFFGNKNELEQALINILNNCKDALNENVEDDDLKYIFVETKKVDNNSVELNIYDSAGGIPEDIIDRVFEPYFTTKHQSIGTGLGLAMTYKIIAERHEQSIRVYNKKFEYNGKIFKGACFSILIKEG